MEVSLGDRVRDSITGFEGIAVAETKWLNGCVRITVQPEKLDKDGKVLEPMTFDEPQIELVKPKLSLLAKMGGGPKPEPSRSKDPV